MERQSMVHAVTVDHDGATYRADYFVEQGIIHACLDGQMVVAPLTTRAPADTVRAMLIGHLAHRARKLVAVSAWLQANRDATTGLSTTN